MEMKTWYEKDIDRLAQYLFENKLDIAENQERAVDVAIMLLNKYLEVSHDKRNPDV